MGRAPADYPVSTRRRAANGHRGRTANAGQRRMQERKKLALGELKDTRACLQREVIGVVRSAEISEGR